MTKEALRAGVFILQVLNLPNSPDFTLNQKDPKTMKPGDTTTAEDIYLTALRSLTDEQFLSAIDKLSQTCKFFPVPAQIIEAARPASLPASEAWEIVQAEMDRCCGLPGVFPNIESQTTCEVVKSMGGLMDIWKNSSNPYQRKEFEKKYNQIVGSGKMVLLDGDVKQIEKGKGRG